MDLEPIESWLKLNQQPYPLVNEFLKQLSSSEIKQDAALLIDHWLAKHQSTINDTELKKSLAWLEQPNHHLISYLQYPERLRAINNPPAVLFLSGNPALLFQPQFAIVGSRKPTSGGRENTVYFTTALARTGLVIISGLAAGIDKIAHQTALEVDGLTAAVLGSGHNYCYPKVHQTLFNQIESKGLIISEFSPDTPVRAYQFPQRNRIISGLSQGLLVVEAAIKSGSLISCRLAADQGRDVFAIPGDITNPMTKGCHHLIRNGACLVENPEQILEELNVSFNPEKNAPQNVDLFHQTEQLSKNESLIFKCINRHPTSIDSLQSRTQIELSELLSILFTLEMKNKVSYSADGYYKKVH
ncbi:MAG: DNA processing protein [Enterobacterales bacterium]|jgi:DNA processing protein